jgi:tRNA 2-thiouridine synthesizing protein A
VASRKSSDPVTLNVSATIDGVQSTAPPSASDAELDARGLMCPEPLMLVRNRLRRMKSGEVLHVTATDPSTLRDFTSLCRFMGHRLLAHTSDAGVLRFWIQRA